MSATAPDYGLNAPMAPTTPGAFAAIPELSVARESLLYFAASHTVGFASLPFEPPRA
jgi:hypothetical protein